MLCAHCKAVKLIPAIFMYEMKDSIITRRQQSTSSNFRISISEHPEEFHNVPYAFFVHFLDECIDLSWRQSNWYHLFRLKRSLRKKSATDQRKKKKMSRKNDILLSRPFTYSSNVTNLSKCFENRIKIDHNFIATQSPEISLLNYEPLKHPF